MENIKEIEVNSIKEVARIIPCECNTGNQELIKHDSKTNRYIYHCKSCNSNTYV